MNRPAPAPAPAPTRRPNLLLAGVVFSVSIVALYWLTSLLDEAILHPTAAVCGWLLAAIGQPNTVDGALIRGATHTFEIVGECTAVFPLVLLLAAVIAYPARPTRRLLGASLAVPAVLLLNQVRLVTLWFVRDFAPDSFDLVHVFLWQPLMVVLVLLLFLAYLEFLAGRSTSDATSRKSAA